MYQMIIIDDESLVLNYLTEFIHKEFPEINVEATFSVSSDAMNYLKSHTVDIVLTDISMPEPTGIDIAKFCFKTTPSTLVIFLSAYKKFEFAHSAIEYNVSDYILKPLSRQQLMDSLTSAVGKLKARTDVFDLTNSTENEYILHCQEVFSDLICSCITDETNLNERLASIGLTSEIADNPMITFNFHIRNLMDWAENEQERVALFNNILHFVCQNTDDVFFGPIWYTKTRIEIIGISKKRNATANDIKTHFERLVMNDLKERFEIDSSLRITDEFPSMKSLLSVRGSSDIDTDSRERFLAYIEQNYKEHLSLEIVSKHFNLSRVYFSVYYKKCTGENFSTTLSRVRINKAKELLKDPNAKITNVMQEVGYKHSTHFYKTFKSIVGCSPAEYQKKNR